MMDKKILISLTTLIILSGIFSVLAEGVEQTVTATVVPGEVSVFSPLDGKVYDNRMIPINITMKNNGTFRYARNDGELVTLCTNCGEYGFYKLKRKPFDEGSNILWIKVIFETGEIDRFVDFTVDFKEPKIFSTMPEEKSIVNKGRFLIKYSEENLQNITLFYKINGNINKLIKTDCESGENKECVFNVDLSEFDRKEIEYWFEVRDYLRVVSSKKTKIKVDLTPPMLTLYLPENREYKRKVPFNLSVSEIARLEYIDKNNPDKLRKLCIWCDEFGFLKEKFKHLKDGFYSLLIRAVDRVGNSDVKEINFTVLKRCKSISECGKVSSELHCDNNILMKRITTPTCVDKKYCESVFEEQIVENCGENSCSEWSNYCFDGDVYRNRSCFNRGCELKSCFEEEFSEEELVEECLSGCSEGECLIPEEPLGNHDVGLSEDYDGFNHSIKINDPDNNPIEADIPTLDCISEYDIKFLTENLGNFTEDVKINLTIKNSTDIIYENFKIKEDLEVGGTTTTGYKNNFVFEEAGDYIVKVEISIDNDIDLINNIAEREIEVIC